MKLEIKKISLSSLIFSGFSLVIFFTALVLGFLAIFVIPNPIWIPVSFFGKLLAVILYALTLFIITMAYVIFLVFIYNFFVGVIGMKGIRFSIEEVEE